MPELVVKLTLPMECHARFEEYVESSLWVFGCGLVVNHERMAGVSGSPEWAWKPLHHAHQMHHDHGHAPHGHHWVINVRNEDGMATCRPLELEDR